jgi:exodeoxyribonuclease-3
VATYVREELAPISFRGLPWDREGRVVVTELEAIGLAIVNVYAVNGTDKRYWDHDLGAFDGDRHAFKRRFNTRLLEDAQKLVARGLSLVLVGDWNIARSKLDTFPRLRTEEPHVLARKEFNETFIPTLEVVDAFRHLHPTARKYTWFNRNARGRLDAARVDFALVSKALVATLASADILEDPARPGASRSRNRHRGGHRPPYVPARPRPKDPIQTAHGRASPFHFGVSRVGWTGAPVASDRHGA